MVGSCGNKTHASVELGFFPPVSHFFFLPEMTTNFGPPLLDFDFSEDWEETDFTTCQNFSPMHLHFRDKTW